MTDNHAEREAEKILQEAARAIQTEQCPQGEECAVHHRVDEEYVLDSAKYARYITYIGEYVVITEDNHAYGEPTFLLKLILGDAKKADLPPRWETSIFHVGDGVIGDLSGKSGAEQRKALRYATTHDVWEEIKSTHEFTVNSLRDGLIDVSKSTEEG